MCEINEKVLARAFEVEAVMSMVISPTRAFTATKKQKLGEGLIGSLCVKKLSEHAIAPTRGSNQAAGYDLYSAYDLLIRAGEKALVKTDLAVAIPEGCYGRVGRSKHE